MYNTWLPSVHNTACIIYSSLKTNPGSRGEACGVSTCVVTLLLRLPSYYTWLTPNCSPSVALDTLAYSIPLIVRQSNNTTTP